MYWLYVIGIPCFFVAFGALWIWVLVRDYSSSQGQFWFGVIWLLLMVWGSFRYITMPHTIEVTDAGSIRFVGLRTSSVESADVNSVRTRPGALIEVRHTRGKIHLLAQFTGFHEFVTDLRAANPNVKVRGL